MSSCQQMLNGIRTVIERIDPFDCTLHGITFRAAITNQSGGVYNLQATTQGMNKNETWYLLAAGDVDMREYDIIQHRNKSWQLGAVSRTVLAGGVIQTQAMLTEVQNG